MAASSPTTDRISALPDELLVHILSFLPYTKQHAATSVLSHRWRHVWTRVPSLDFSCYHAQDLVTLCLCLCLRLSTTLCLHRLQAHIGHIALPDTTADDEPHRLADLVAEWIALAAPRSLLELALVSHLPLSHQRPSTYPRLQPALPLSISATLQALQLDGFDLKDVHFDASFTCLRILLLCGVQLKDQQLKDLLRLYPNLENLCVLSCGRWLQQGRWWLNGIFVCSAVNPRLRNLKLWSHFGRVVVDAVGLRYLDIGAQVRSELRVGHRPQLKEAFFGTSWRMPPSLYGAEILTVGPEVLQSRGCEVLDSFFPEMTSLLKSQHKAMTSNLLSNLLTEIMSREEGPQNSQLAEGSDEVQELWCEVGS